MFQKRNHGGTGSGTVGGQGGRGPGLLLLPRGWARGQVRPWILAPALDFSERPPGGQWPVWEIVPEPVSGLASPQPSLSRLPCRPRDRTIQTPCMYQVQRQLGRECWGNPGGAEPSLCSGLSLEREPGHPGQDTATPKVLLGPPGGHRPDATRGPKKGRPQLDCCHGREGARLSCSTGHPDPLGGARTCFLLAGP